MEGLDLTDKPVQIFHGKTLQAKDLVPLKDLGGEGGKCMIWGDVFATEVKGQLPQDLFGVHHRLYRLHLPQGARPRRGKTAPSGRV